jgi:hypothetical protein
MIEKYRGALFYNHQNDRIDFRYDIDGTTEGGLHCGQCFDVKIKGKWIPTRLEMSDEWYLVGTGIKGVDNISGLLAIL